MHHILLHTAYSPQLTRDTAWYGVKPTARCRNNPQWLHASIARETATQRDAWMVEVGFQSGVVGGWGTDAPAYSNNRE
jgi:hypothetical protein